MEDERQRRKKHANIMVGNSQSSLVSRPCSNMVLSRVVLEVGSHFDATAMEVELILV